MRHFRYAGLGAAVLALGACTNMGNVPASQTQTTSGSVVPPAIASAPGAIASTPAEGQLVTVRARITRIDPSNRRVTLLGPSNEQVTVTAGPEVVNFPQLRIGDVVILRFYRSVAFVVSDPNAPLPPSSSTDVPVGAAPGSLPAGIVGQRITVTGTVVSVDVAAHTISVVPREGGAIRTFLVTNPQRIAALSKVSVGDQISAVITDALAVRIDKNASGR